MKKFLTKTLAISILLSTNAIAQVGTIFQNDGYFEEIKIMCISNFVFLSYEKKEEWKFVQMMGNDGKPRKCKITGKTAVFDDIAVFDGDVISSEETRGRYINKNKKGEK